MFYSVWYKIVMIRTNPYTPEQVAEVLQISKNTVYSLINRGEIVAKKIGKAYRIPAQSLSFFMTGLDDDLYNAQREDQRSVAQIEEEIASVRKSKSA
ncbi:MAG: binding domain protein, excisionase family protein [Candidatus Gottesmanbacteria bacterium GW2011_GWA1_47_8]|nr:MAG: binding domain protein, excisionase family protein [Candidatus Gottesmanbacteria bacterium GW2011_GWA1_47_8]